MICFKDVVKKYDDLKALDNVDITIPDGVIYGLIGKSGAGKSTLLRTINKLEAIDSGSITVDGVEVTSLEGSRLRQYRRNVGMIFQHFSLLETKTVYKNISLPLECNGFKKDAIDKRVKELAEIVGLSDKLNQKPRNLSGGQKQRVAIARSLALNPKILLCDEATSALDPLTTKSILSLLKKINEELKITIVIVTHQMEVVKEVCEQVAILSDGKVLDVGKCEDLFVSNNQALKTLVDEELIVPDTGINIKLYFKKEMTVDSIITRMARDLDIDFSIVWGKLEKFRDNVLGNLIINVKKEHKELVEKYLDEKQILWEEIENDVK